MKNKHEAFDMFKNEVENHLNKKKKTLRSGRWCKYFSNDFNLFCEQDMIHQYFAPKTPEQSGLTERKKKY